MKKRFISLCLIAVLSLALFIPVHAEFIPEESVSSVIVMGNGITVEITLIVHNTSTVSRAASTKTASKTAVYKYNGAEIATIVIDANFGYNGTSSWVNSSSVSKSVASGWTYSGESLTNFGGTATVTATLSKLFTPNVNVNTSITCSPSGTIS